MANILNNTDTNKVEELLKQTEANVEYFDKTTKGLVEAETHHLDKLMQDIYRSIIKKDDSEIPLDSLSNYYIELTSLLYFMGEKLEKLSTRSDLAKAAAKEIYNKAYLENQIKDAEKKNKTTVAENQAVAEGASIYESTVQSMYEHATKIVKYKIDAGYEMVKTLSKLITRKMQEMSLSNFNPGVAISPFGAPNPTKTPLYE